MEIPLPILGSWFQYFDRSFLLTLGPPEQVLTPNPQRWGLLLWNAGTGTQFAGPFNPSGAAGLMPLLGSVQPMKIFFPEFGGLVQAAWFAQSNPVGQAVGIWEILYMPPAMSEAVTLSDLEE